MLQPEAARSLCASPMAWISAATTTAGYQAPVAWGLPRSEEQGALARQLTTMLSSLGSSNAKSCRRAGDGDGGTAGPERAGSVRHGHCKRNVLVGLRLGRDVLRLSWTVPLPVTGLVAEAAVMARSVRARLHARTDGQGSQLERSRVDLAGLPSRRASCATQKSAGAGPPSPLAPFLA